MIIFANRSTKEGGMKKETIVKFKEAIGYLKEGACATLAVKMAGLAGGPNIKRFREWGKKHGHKRIIKLSINRKTSKSFLSKYYKEMFVKHLVK